MRASVRGAVGILFAAAALAVAPVCAAQAPADPLCLPAILAKPTPPEAAEMWRRSANAPTVLFDYLDRAALRKALEALPHGRRCYRALSAGSINALEGAPPVERPAP